MGKHYDIENDVKRLLLADLQEPKARKLERRIATWVFEGSTETQFDRLLMTITSTCKIGTMNRVSRQPRSIQHVAVSLRNALSARIVSARRYALILRLAGRQMYIAHLRKCKGVHPLQPNKVTLQENEFLGIIWFLHGCYTQIGATIDQAMSFALYLLEVYAHDHQRCIDKPRLDYSNDAFDYENLADIALSTINLATTVAPGEKAMERKWLDQIIDHLEHDATVRQTWTAIIRILNRYHQTKTDCPQINVVIADDDNVDAINADWVRRIQEGVLCVSPQQHTILARQGIANQERIERNNRECHERITWVVAHEARLQEKMAELRTAIKEHPRRGLRPAGFDHVDINVTLLYEVGFRSIAFYPEGNRFPDTEIHFIMKGITPHLLIYKTGFHGFSCADWRILDNRFPEAQEQFRLLCEYVVTDILYRLTAGERQLRQKKNGGHHGATSTASRPSIPRRLIHVSVPYYRRNLPAGQEASEEAKIAAAKVGWQLDPGETFVTDYNYNIVPATYQEGRIVHQLPTEAFATYGDADLLEGIGGTL